MPRTGRHVLPRDRARGRVLLPALLLAASGGAFGGLAVLPAAPDAVAAAPAVPDRAPTRWSAQDATGALPAERDPALAARSRLRASRERSPADSPTSRADPGPAGDAGPADDLGWGSADARPVAPLPPPPPPAPPPPPPPPPPAVVRPEFARPGVGPLTSRFGHRWGRLHAGIDLAAGTGAPVSAAADGVVLSASSEGGYGLVVRLQHAENTVTVYAHLSALLVEPGQAVHAGNVLGREGSSGHSTGPHLHFEVRVGDVPVDPAAWLRARGVVL